VCCVKAKAADESDKKDASSSLSSAASSSSSMLSLAAVAAPSASVGKDRRQHGTTVCQLRLFVCLFLVLGSRSTQPSIPPG